MFIGKTRHSLKLACVLLLPAILGACSVLDGSFTSESRDKSAATQEFSLESMMRLADAASRVGDQGSALSLYERAHQNYPQAKEPMVAAGALYRRMGVPDRAVTAYREALAVAPTDREARFGLGASLIEKGEPKEALSIFDAQIADDPLDARAHNGRGIALDKGGRHEDAQASYRKGLKLAPDDISLRNNLGLSLAMAGSIKDSLALLKPLAASPNANERVKATLAYVMAMPVPEVRASAQAKVDVHPLKAGESSPPVAAAAPEGAAKQAGAPIDSASEKGGPAPQTVEPLIPISMRVVVPWHVTAMAAPESAATITGTPTDSASEQGAPAQKAVEPLIPISMRVVVPWHASAVEAAPTAPAVSDQPSVVQEAPKTSETVQIATAPVEKSARLRCDSAGQMPAYEIQITAQRTEEQALETWAGVKQVAPGLVAPFDAKVKIADLGSEKGTFFRIRLEPKLIRVAAKSLCDELKDRRVDCFVFRNVAGNGRSGCASAR